MSKAKPNTIRVRVQPNAGQNKVMRFQEGVWYIKIAAPPVEGKANEELVEFLGKVLDVGKRSLSVEKGATGKNKIVAIEGITPEQIAERLGKEL